MKKEVVVVALCVILVCFIFGFENVKAEVNGIILSDSSYGGMIYPDTFCISTPKHMTIGESYRVLVDVKNTGTRAYFLVTLVAPDEFIYLDFDAKMVELDKGESRRIVFLMTPTNPHIGELNITAKLYLLSPLLMEIDSTADSVFLIKRNFSTEGIIASISITVVAISAISVVTLFLFYKKKSAAKRKP